MFRNKYINSNAIHLTARIISNDLWKEYKLKFEPFNVKLKYEVILFSVVLTILTCFFIVKLKIKLSTKIV